MHVFLVIGLFKLMLNTSILKLRFSLLFVNISKVDIFKIQAFEESEEISDGLRLENEELRSQLKEQRDGYKQNHHAQ